MTKNEMIEWLGGYRKSTLRVDVLKSQLAEMEMLGTSTTPSYKVKGGTAKGLISDKVGDFISRKANLEMMISDEISMQLQLQMDIRQAISKIENCLYRTLLEERFLNGKKFWQIASITNYSESHIKNVLMDNAINELYFFVKCCEKK